MRKSIMLLAICLTLACSFFAPLQPTPTAAVPTSTVQPTLTAGPTISPAPPTATAVPTEVSTATAQPTAAGEFRFTAADVHFHPDPELYSGDQVSVEVVADGAPDGWRDAQVSLYADATGADPLGQANLTPSGLGARLAATFTWVWDTSGLEGPQTLRVVVKPALTPGGPTEAAQTITATVNLLPAEARPMPEPLASWASTESDCCVFHYLTGTAAERDLDKIKAAADEAFAHVARVLGVELNHKVVFTLMSRLLGHGGFASNEISLTYIDRNPAEGDLFNLFAHESTHVLDRKIARTKPTLMTEGLAVYVAGGHFKQENLERRAAALVSMDRYIPLATLADGFYPSQHEIGYLEAGAFIQYLVQRFGWDRFRTTYASFQSAPSEARMLDAALTAEYGLSLSTLEDDWLESLRALPPNQAEQDDLSLTVRLFDSLRRYQRLKDPSAYFLYAWLPDATQARSRHITADFVRHPTAPDSIALETMLAAAGASLNEHQYDAASQLLDAVNAALDASSLEADPLSAEYLQVVDEALAAGYEPQRITLDDASARVEAIRNWPRLDELSLVRVDNGWRLASGRPEDWLGLAHAIIGPGRAGAR